MQEVVEERPAPHTLRALHPDVGRILAAAVPYPERIECRHQMRRVLLVYADILMDLALAFLRKDRRRTLLQNIGDTVRLGRAVAHPHRIQREPAARELLRDDRIAEARPRKARRLGEGADLNGAGLCALDLKDAVRDLLILDERFVGGIKEDDRIGFVRVIHPCFQMRT